MYDEFDESTDALEDVLGDALDDASEDAHDKEFALPKLDEVRERNFSRVAVALLKNAISRDNDAALWTALLNQRFALSDYVNRIGLALVVDEVDGYAFLKQREYADRQDEIPRLIPRYQLSYPISLLLILLRKKLLELDVAGGDGRLIITRDQIIDALRVFYKDTTNEIKTIKTIERNIADICKMGFMRKLANSDDTYEVQRILRSFINADWMNTADTTLDAYLRFELGDSYEEGSDDDDSI